MASRRSILNTWSGELQRWMFNDRNMVNYMFKYLLNYTPTSITLGDAEAFVIGSVTIDDDLSGNKLDFAVNSASDHTLTGANAGAGNFDISIDGDFIGTIGATTPAAGAFTTIASSGIATLTALDGPIGGVTPAAGAFTTIASSGIATLTALDGPIGGVTPAAGLFTTIGGSAVTSTSLPGRIFSVDLALPGTVAVDFDSGVACGIMGAQTSAIYTVDTEYKTYLRDYVTGTDTIVVLANGDPMLTPAAGPEEAGDAFIVACTSQFSVLNLDMNAFATWGANGGKWQYATAADTWSDLTIIFDTSDATDATTGLRSMQQDGVLTFIPPSDWAAAVHTGVGSGTTMAAGYCIQYVLTAVQLTQTPTAQAATRGGIPYGATPNTGHRVDSACVLSKMNFHAGTDSASNADTKFLLHNITQNTWSAETTWTKDLPNFYVADIAMTLAAADEICLEITQEDGTTEYANIIANIKAVEA